MNEQPESAGDQPAAHPSDLDVNQDDAGGVPPAVFFFVALFVALVAGIAYHMSRQQEMEEAGARDREPAA